VYIAGEEEEDGKEKEYEAAGDAEEEDAFSLAEIWSSSARTDCASARPS
jgi:hypothetical protein